MVSHPNFDPECARRLNEVIARGAGRGLAAVFDFDNTLICGDIGEATLAWLIRQGKITARPGLFPPIQVGERVIEANTSADLAIYYDALLNPTVHGSKDPTPLASGYVWAVEVMRELTVKDVVDATGAVWGLSEPGRHPHIEATPGGRSYPVPFVYPEMIELLSELLQNGYKVWIFSASNAWSVRWVVTRILNPELVRRGAGPGIPPEQVVGITSLLRAVDGELSKDVVLVREDAAYARLEETAVSQWQISPLLQFPVPTYSGKVGLIWEALGRAPYFGAGDSPGDLSMLSFCEHRLWVHRRGKDAYRRAMLERRKPDEAERWIEHEAKTPPGPVAERR